MDEKLDPVELREIARYTEETALSALAAYSTVPIPLYSGNLQDFPRPSQPDQAAEEGLAALRETVERVVASIYTVAFGLEHGLEVPPALLIPILPYIEAFRAR
jgi:hypothetical protein